MNNFESTIVFLVGYESTSGWYSLYICRLLSQFGHRCHIYFPPELAEQNPKLYNLLESVIILPNVSVIEPVNLPVKIDYLISGLFGDFNFKSWFLELHENIKQVNIKNKLNTDF